MAIPKTKRLQALELLAVGTSQRQTAITLGIARETIAKLLLDPEFSKELNDARTEYLTEYRDALRLQLPLALATKIRVMQGDNLNAANSAANDVLKATGVVNDLQNGTSNDIVMTLGKMPDDSDYKPEAPQVPEGAER